MGESSSVVVAAIEAWDTLVEGATPLVSCQHQLQTSRWFVSVS